jgi:hypothetical protein
MSVITRCVPMMLCLMTAVSAPFGSVFGAFACQGQQCSAYVTRNIQVDQQKWMWDCWAASTTNYLKFFGVYVPQEEIVLSNVQAPTLGSPPLMNQAQNRPYQDVSGRTVLVRQIAVSDNFTAALTGNLRHGRQDFNNIGLINFLRNETPIFYGDTQHAMVLVGVTFVQTPMGPNILDGMVADPAIGGYRHLQQNELQGMYAAVLSVTAQGGVGAPAATSLPPQFAQAPDQGPLPGQMPNPITTLPGGMTLTCRFIGGPRAGGFQNFSGTGVAPIPVGAPCNDGAGSFGFGQ